MREEEQDSDSGEGERGSTHPSSVADTRMHAQTNTYTHKR